MADSPSQYSSNKTHLQDPHPSSSTPTKPTSKSKFFFHYFFSKSLIFILVLLLLSFFPSQVPDFFKKSTIINKIWELIYLLVIGIVVCYGLFSRKIDRVYYTSSDDDNICAKESSYLSGVSQISSIFENGIQNSYGFDEIERSEFGKSVGKGVNLNQYFLGESLVVINDEKYVLEQFSKSKSIERNRVLKSNDFDAGNGKSVVEDCSNEGNGKSMKFRGLVPIKLEERFKENDSNSDSRTPLNWRSKSMRLENPERVSSGSVGVLDFENMTSKSMRFSMPSETKNSSKTREFGIGSSSKMNNQSSSKETPKDCSKIRVEDSNGTRKEEDFFGWLKAEQQEFDPNIKSKSTHHRSSETNVGTSEPVLGKSDSSNSNQKPAGFIYKRGKSVRTNRPKEQVFEAKVETGSKPVTNATTNANLDETRIVNDDLSDTEPHSGEVDRKAAEFIAKFREQIRLQQAASARRLNLW